MATLVSTNPTLADVAKSLDPDGSVATVVEILNQTSELLSYIPWYEGNLPTGHRHVIRSGIPQPTWRRLNYGVQPTKSSRIPVTDNTGILEDYAECDKEVADLNGNTASFRLSEDKPHIEGMSQKFQTTFFYGNEGTEPEAFTGLAPRFSALSPATAQSADNVIDAGGTGSDCTSIWLIGFGQHSVHGLYPKGSKAGISVNDKGQVTIENADGNNGRMEAYRTHYQWKCGLSVRDWRYVVRIANIKTSTLTKDASAGADLLDLIAQAFEIPPNLNGAVLCCNRKIKSFLRRQQKNSKNVQISMEQAAGKTVMRIDEVPLVRCDQILNTETNIT